MKRTAFLFGLFCAICFAAVTLPAGAQDPAAEESSEQEFARTFRLIGLDDRPKLREQVRLLARRSRQSILENSSLQWPGQTIIVWADAETYREKTGFNPEHTAAAASPANNTVYINESAWLRSEPGELQKTMVHELGHLLLGSLPGGKRLPLWANEGIVMHLAGQLSWEEQIRLLGAHAFGQLPELKNLEEEFPRSPGAQTLAYRMSYAAIDVVAQSFGDRPGGVSRLLSRLADPERGPPTAEEFWDPFRREGWQRATEQSLGSRFSTGLIMFTSTGTIFLLMAILFVIAYLVTRARRTQRARELEEEWEPWEESLTDEDIQDIYGDREDRWDV